MITEMGVKVTRDAALTHTPGVVAIGDDDTGLTLTLETYDELVIAARLARELLASCDDLLTSDEPSTRATARELLVDLIADATAYIARLDAEDRCTCTLVNVNGRAELRAVTPCPSHPDAPRADPDHADIGRIMAAHRGEETEIYP